MLVFSPRRCRGSKWIFFAVLCVGSCLSRVDAQDCCEGTIPLTTPIAEQASQPLDETKVVQGQLPGADEKLPAAAEPEMEIRSALAAYVEAFNRQDSIALAAQWNQDGVFTDQETGQQTNGREAIASRFLALFDQRNDLTLAGRLDTIRLVRPDVARVTGYTVSVGDDQAPLESQFTAILIREDGQWLFDTIDETPLPESTSPDSSGADDPLANLEFLVGEWVDLDGESRTETTATWGIDGSFLVRSYKVDRGDELLVQGTQVIGWDPRQQRIRCWMFDSDGTFGEGIWTPSENGWTVKITETLASGSIAGATQSITMIDQDTLSIQMVGREVDGVTLPSSNAVRVVRVHHADDVTDQ